MLMTASCFHPSPGHEQSQGSVQSVVRARPSGVTRFINTLLVGGAASPRDDMPTAIVAREVPLRGPDFDVPRRVHGKVCGEEAAYGGLRAIVFATLLMSKPSVYRARYIGLLRAKGIDAGGSRRRSAKIPREEMRGLALRSLRCRAGT